MSGIAFFRNRNFVSGRKLAMSLAFSGLSLAPLAIPLPAHGRTQAVAQAEQLKAEIAGKVDRELRPFYAARGYRPMWLGADGRFDPAVAELMQRVETSRLDSIKSRKLGAGSLRKLLRRASSGDLDDLAGAELKLSRMLVKYVQLMRAARRSDMIYESQALAPVVPTAAVALGNAARDKSLLHHVETMGWMHPFYAPMRDALLDRGLSNQQRAMIWQNLDRIRALPATAARKYILVDAASARLWMYEGGRPVDTMRVVVGKAETQTPMMAGFMRYAIVNPYWNIPSDLVQNTIAPNAIEKGPGYFDSGGYEVLSDWSAKPARLDPGTIDWAAVAAGTRQVRVRQLPGGSNFMGKVKYEFPNPQGIYLHDTPNRELLRRDVRQLSNGCVRLEDAGRLGRWLLGKPLPRRPREVEMRIDLPQLVPVYITYLSAMPEDGRITFHGDVYRRDAGQRLARAD